MNMMCVCVMCVSLSLSLSSSLSPSLHQPGYAQLQEELKKIDALEPKLPMLQLLCQAHHFFPYQRDQIFHLLQELDGRNMEKIGT